MQESIFFVDLESIAMVPTRVQVSDLDKNVGLHEIGCSLMGWIKTLGRTRRKHAAEEPKDGGERTIFDPPWRNSIRRKPRGVIVWYLGVDDTFELLIATSAHANKVDQRPVRDVNVPVERSKRKR